MLINLLDHMVNVSNLKYPQKGIVVDNIDPEMIGRLKVSIPGLLTGPIADLPWIYQESPASLGGGEFVSGFTVPEIGTEIIVKFPFEDIYSGFYSSFWQSATTHPVDFDNNYPESYGFRDSNGNYIHVNKLTELLKLHHSSGVHVEITASGNVRLILPSGRAMFLDGDLEVSGNISTDGSISAKLNVTATGALAGASISAGGLSAPDGGNVEIDGIDFITHVHVENGGAGPTDPPS